jgi:hypothetical protein
MLSLGGLWLIPLQFVPIHRKKEPSIGFLLLAMGVLTEA